MGYPGPLHIVLLLHQLFIPHLQHERVQEIWMKSETHERAKRQCPFCGKFVLASATQCPKCRENLTESRSARHGAARKGKLRQGLLCMLLAGVIHYFAGGYGAMDLPFSIDPTLTIYLSPLLFLIGLGLVIYDICLRIFP